MTVRQEHLSSILDGDDANSMDDAAPPDAAALHAERLARETAESAAEAAALRLSVSQTQMAEYLAQRGEEQARAAASARRLEELLLAAAAGGGGGGAAAEAHRLAEELSAAAAEAAAAAAQMRAEAGKRTSVQAELGAPGAGDVEMRGAKKAAGSSEGSDGGDDGDEAAGGAAPNGAAPSGAAPSGAAPNGAAPAAGEYAPDSFRERAKYIPLRLTHDERRLLRLLEGALAVSEYTDKVDVLSHRSRTARAHAQIKDLCAILCGLAVAQSFRHGQALLADRNFDDPVLANFFQTCFEVGRRHKVMCPERMRDGYGKLMYMLMDSASPEVLELLGFSAVRPLQTVAAALEAGGAAAMLDDPLMAEATAEIAAPPGAPRAETQRRIKAKERARAALARRYATPAMPEDDLLRCLYSVGDNNSFLAYARDPVDRMIALLGARFSPDRPEPSLAIAAGRGGARLSHGHARQHTYVLQSLTLWREVAHDMFKLWWLAEQDLLSPRNPYRLQNTGQGLQRVQGAPLVGRAMAAILGRCQRRVGSWVGSSVVHLGDHNVPNALIFIDKYTQVPRILNPVCLVVEALPRLAAADSRLAEYIRQAHGGVEAAQTEILADFFRHAFDGSGADNSFDAGSCIDGRLTSAWNWCAKIESKKFFPLFLLAGFVGFDGDVK